MIFITYIFLVVIAVYVYKIHKTQKQMAKEVHEIYSGIRAAALKE